MEVTIRRSTNLDTFEKKIEETMEAGESIIYFHHYQRHQVSLHQLLTSNNTRRLSHSWMKYLEIHLCIKLCPTANLNAEKLQKHVGMALI